MYNRNSDDIHNTSNESEVSTIITKTSPCKIKRFIFSSVKTENFIRKKNNVFDIFAQNINCGYMLDPPCRSDSNEYQQSMLRIKNKKNIYNSYNFYTEIYMSFKIKDVVPIFYSNFNVKMTPQNDVTSFLI